MTQAPSTRARKAGRLGVVLASVVSAAIALTGCSAGGGTVTVDVPALADGALPDATQSELQAAVEQAMAASGSSGAIVGVWVPWSGAWVAGLGTQAPDSDTKVTSDMSFRVGDVTREMTCDALYGLVADDKLALDDSVDSLVIGVADEQDITVEELCDSTSGLGNLPASIRSRALKVPDRQWDPRALASFGLGGEQGTQGEYKESDTGYLLLGLALERASGEDASTYLDDYVFEPLGLTSTSLPGKAAAEPAPAPALQGNQSTKKDGAWQCDAPQDITKMSASLGFTDAGVTSTITDLGQYAAANAVQSLRAEGGPDKFADPVSVGSDAPTWYTAAGGSRIAGSLIGQHSAFPGYMTAAYSDPDTGMTIAVVLNNSAAGDAFPSYLAWELAAIASKAPAASGETAPEYGLPWTAETYQQQIVDSAICPIG